MVRAKWCFRMSTDDAAMTDDMSLLHSADKEAVTWQTYLMHVKPLLSWHQCQCYNCKNVERMHYVGRWRDKLCCNLSVVADHQNPGDNDVWDGSPPSTWGHWQLWYGHQVWQMVKQNGHSMWCVAWKNTGANYWKDVIMRHYWNMA